MKVQYTLAVHFSILDPKVFNGLSLPAYLPVSDPGGRNENFELSRFAISCSIYTATVHVDAITAILSVCLEFGDFLLPIDLSRLEYLRACYLAPYEEKHPHFQNQRE